MAANPATEPAARMSDSDAANLIAQLPDDVLNFQGDEPEEANEAATPEQEPAGEEGADDGVEAQADPEAEDATEEPQPEGSEEDPIFEVTLPGGEKSDVPLSELAAGYSRLQDYKQKTAALAQERREFEQSKETELTGVKNYEQQLRNTLEFYMSLNPVGEEPSVSMLNPNSADYNPDAYHLAKAQYEQKVREYNVANQRLSFIRQQEQQRLDQQQKEVVKAEQAKLREIMPELFAEDPQVQASNRTAFLGNLEQHYGIDAATVAQVLDHRFYKLAADALKFRAMNRDAPAVTARLKVKPKVVKPGVRNTQVNPGQKQQADARARLRKSGSVQDAAAVFEGLL